LVYPKRRASRDPNHLHASVVQGLPLDLQVVAILLIRILPLGIHIILLDEPPVVIVLLSILRRRHAPHAVRAPRGLCIALGGLLRNRITGIDPIRVHVDGRAEVVDVCLEGLAADFALEVADARLLLDGDADGLFVVAEEALEGCWEFLLL
jgi:hypothetical protein